MPRNEKTPVLPEVLTLIGSRCQNLTQLTISGGGGN